MNAKLDFTTSTWFICVPGATIRSKDRDLLFIGYMALMLDSSLPKPDISDPLEMHIKVDLTFKVLRTKRQIFNRASAA